MGFCGIVFYKQYFHLKTAFLRVRCMCQCATKWSSTCPAVTEVYSFPPTPPPSAGCEWYFHQCHCPLLAVDGTSTNATTLCWL